MFMQPNARGYYYQNESIPLYALGYDSPVEIIIKDVNGTPVTQMAPPAKGKLAYQVWTVPVDQKPGNYTINVKPTGNHKDCFGQDGAYSLKVEVQQAAELDHNGGGPRPPSTSTRATMALPGWAPLAMVAAVLIVGVPIGILLIRKKKD
jgi:hypothetical protein